MLSRTTMFLKLFFLVYSVSPHLLKCFLLEAPLNLWEHLHWIHYKWPLKQKKCKLNWWSKNHNNNTLTTNFVTKWKHFAPSTIITCNQALFCVKTHHGHKVDLTRNLVELWRQQLLKATWCTSWTWQWGWAISTQRMYEATCSNFGKLKTTTWQ
jgi:hypothetical protein